MIVYMLKSRALLWGLAVIGLIVLIAGISAGFAKGGLPGPGWLIAGITGALTAGGAAAAALRPVFVKVVQSGVDQSIRRADTARELRERLGGAKAKFPRVSEIRNRALRYGVQQAIPLDGGAAVGLSADLPRYLPRTIDGPLRSALTARSTTGGMVILKGNSTWGKSRSMFEAVSQVLGDWSIVAPRDAADVRDLVASGMSLTRTVIWLDELVNFLTGSDPILSDVVQRAVDKGAILVGTIWKDDFAALTAPPKKGSADGFARPAHGSGAVDALAGARAILTATYRDLIEMPRDLDEDEKAVASALAKQDSRWAQAIADAGELSPIQVLAAAPQLLDRYRHPDDEAGGVVLRAAVALQAMEHPLPVPRNLLERVAKEALPPTLEVEPDRWFEDALAWARRPVRGTIAPLKIYRDGTDGTEGYAAPDLLVSAARGDGKLKSLVDLDLISTYATPEACASIGDFFYYRDERDDAKPLLRRAAEQGIAGALGPYGSLLAEDGRVDEAEEWYFKALAAGQTAALLNLGNLLSEQDGRAGEAEEWYRKAVDAGQKDAEFNLGVMLSEQEGRAGEAEAWYLKAATSGDSAAMNNVGLLLSEQEGRAGEAEEWYRKAVDAGDVGAILNLGNLLSEQEGRAAEAEEWYRKAVDADQADALFNLGNLFSEQEGRAAEAEEWYRKAAKARQTEALGNLGLLLSEQEGRAGEAEEWYRKAIDAGNTGAILNLGNLLSEQEGRAAEAEEWYRKAAESGETAAMFNLGLLLAMQGERAREAEEWFHRALDAGDTEVALNLGNLLSEQEGRAGEAEEWYRKAADEGRAAAMFNLGLLLAEQEGRAGEAEEWYRKAVDAGQVHALTGLGLLLAEQEGRVAEAEEWYRKAIDAGGTDALTGLGLLLSDQEGRVEEAEECYRRACDAGDTHALSGLAGLLADQNDRVAEAEQWYRKAIDAGHTGALNELGELLKVQGRYAEARPLLDEGIAVGDPYAMWTMGELDLIEGRREEARTWLLKAVALGVTEAAQLLAEEFGEDQPPT